MGYLSELLQSRFWERAGGFEVPRFLTPAGWRRWSVPISPNELGSVSQGALVDINLADVDVLKRTLSVPVGRLPEVRSMLQSEIDLEFPGQSQNLVWALGPVKRHGKLFECEVLLVHRRSLSMLENGSWRLRTVSANGSDGLTYLVQDLRSDTDRPIRHWSFVNLAVLVSVLGFIYFSQIGETTHAQLSLAELQAAEAELVEYLSAQRASEIEQAEAEERIVLALQTFERDRGHVSYLRDLTTALDSESWVSEYAYNNGLLQLSGFTNVSAAVFVNRLIELDWVSDAQLTRPFIQDPISRSNRFSIEISVVDNAN